MRELKFALIGAGFGSQYQLAAWGEVSGARCGAAISQKPLGSLSWQTLTHTSLMYRVSISARQPNSIAKLVRCAPILLVKMWPPL